METARLILRPFELSDAAALYHYAKNPKIGLNAGWQPHQDLAESTSILKNVLMADQTFALAFKLTPDKIIGSISIKAPTKDFMAADSAELGYWLAEEFWGQGLMTEAVRAIIQHCFNDLQYGSLWCGYYDGNDQSKRVQEKVGFTYQLSRTVDVTLLHENRLEHFLKLNNPNGNEM
ncbi:GNAT family N-acetyltransferase [Periweissella ghanensis]|uniref:N-acetyltransferase domain-containing protein n=1 Tax=Periweissella ghanensis TaxID=467997 RepID=A0ABN8BNS0_9LACO|nr:GNAT family N-acetyltransferase [Periweissella ghanensis]MCM0601227.1 GNAT family N-acetyltransferase [Periweissella ghanensis]CAH0418027.1 hypothetical protein WGH24286_00443 [Periweissella ghanensis]